MFISYNMMFDKETFIKSKDLSLKHKLFNINKGSS